MRSKVCPVCGNNDWQGFGGGWRTCEGSMPDGSACMYAYNVATGEEEFE
ncbi:hypothetical protein N9U68_00290 [Euryarchaeota archaeon]|nr:hypothetical protein [Euryarchaeota archaeon]